MACSSINIASSNIVFGNDQPMVIVGGCNVLESAQLADEVASHFKEVTDRLGMSYVFKASFDKANRSSIHSFRGPGLKDGIVMLADIKERYQLPVLTDVHEPHQVQPVAEVADIVQLPAFLSRQTDLVQALGKSDAIINIKKAQFLAPEEMRHIIQKCEEAGNDKVMLCERGTSFGYNNLVVDFLGFEAMKSFGCPLLFDVTHSLQKPGARADSADGRGEQAYSLAKAGVSQKIAGLFLEAHPDPSVARCDGPSALSLQQLEPFLKGLQELDQLVKKQKL